MISNSAKFVLRAIYVAQDPLSEKYRNAVSFNLNELLEPDTLDELKSVGFIGEDHKITQKGVNYLTRPSANVNFFKLVSNQSANSLIFLIHLALGQIGKRGSLNQAAYEFWETKLDAIYDLLQTATMESLKNKYLDMVAKNNQ